MSCTSRWTPLRQTSRVITTMLTVPEGLTLSGSGENCVGSMALGMTYTSEGSSWQRSTTFSLEVYDTVTTVSASERTKRSSALRLMSVGELMPKLECSVYTTR